MSKAQEIGQKVQGQTLDAVRRTQDAVVEALAAWTERANKIPGYSSLLKQWPVATEVIDSNFDFAERLLSSQRDFAGRLVAATTPKAVTPEKTAPKAVTPEKTAPAAVTKTVPAAITKTAPAAVKKPAARKTVTAAKKASAVQPPAQHGNTSNEQGGLT
jgi:hypothetical protein